MQCERDIITESRIRRVHSRENNNRTECLIDIQRYAFGGYAVKKDSIEL